MAKFDLTVRRQWGRVKCAGVGEGGRKREDGNCKFASGIWQKNGDHPRN